MFLNKSKKKALHEPEMILYLNFVFLINWFGFFCRKTLSDKRSKAKSKTIVVLIIIVLITPFDNVVDLKHFKL